MRPVFNGKSQVSMFEMTKLVSGHLKSTLIRLTTRSGLNGWNPRQLFSRPRAGLLSRGRCLLRTKCAGGASPCARRDLSPTGFSVKILRLAAFLRCVLRLLGSQLRAGGSELADRFRTRPRQKPKPVTSCSCSISPARTGAPWCQVLHAEVFSKPEFEQYAKNNLVLMTVDFPRAQTAQQRSATAKRSTGAAAIEIEGFPTIVILNSEGKQVGLLGYMPGGPEAFINELKKLPKS